MSTNILNNRTMDGVYANLNFNLCNTNGYPEGGILSAIGNTPLVKLNRFLKDARFNLFAKLEGYNPGGSSKDRPAMNILRHGIKSGTIQPDTVIIESSSGNLGVGLAQACAYFGLRFICVADAKTTLQNLRLIESYGATIELVLDPHPATGEFLQARIDRVKELLEITENSFWPNQYANLYNPMSHHQTMHEIALALAGQVDYLFCATSTCGTLRGCSEYIREHGLTTQIVAVDAIGSVIFGGEKLKRLIPGHGAAVRPPLYRPGLADEVIHVSDIDCIVGCRRLARQEAILAGGSSGAVIMAMDKVKDEIPTDANCVLIFPDRGERYLDTVYSDIWVNEHFGDISELWREAKEEQTCIPTIS